MERIIDKCILLLPGIWVVFMIAEWGCAVGISLIAIVYLALSEYLENWRLSLAWMAVYGVFCLFFRESGGFLALVLYDLTVVLESEGLGKRKSDGGGVLQEYRYVLWILTGAALVALGYFLWYRARGVYTVFMVELFAGLVALWMGIRTNKLLALRERLIHLRDDSTETTNALKRRQKEMMERQDYEIHLATLQERNRIAREIHDNVGHMLTRSILQVGALEVVYRDHPVCEQLHEINETLNDAMTNIRQSVRDLHDESMDLEQSVRDAARELGSRFRVELEYDMGHNVARNVKYCLLSITKEAISNIGRHCNGDRVRLIYREHPAFYQLAIDDNGTDIHMHRQPGIGLMNMQERVEALGGRISFVTKRGFEIRIMIPKKEGKTCE